MSATIGNGLSGGSAIGRRNLRLVKQLEDNGFSVSAFYTGRNSVEHQSGIEKIDGYRSAVHTLWAAAGFHTGGLTKKSEEDLTGLLQSGQFDILFLDSSLLGALAKIAKSTNSRVRVITYFHNVEFKYGLERCRVESIKYAPLLPAIYMAEKNAIRYSDVILGVCHRDSDLLRHRYGRRFDAVVPVSVSDVFDYRRVSNVATNRLLFVGSDFFANIEGLDWLIKEVLSDSDCGVSLDIVGSGMEKYRDRFSRKNVNVIGSVKDIGDYYYRAHAVIMPIFSGSGMKVKTAEALHFGRYLICTPESLVGYQPPTKDVFLCVEKIDFKNAFGRLKELPQNGYSVHNRSVFESLYSDSVVFDQLKKIILNLE